MKILIKRVILKDHCDVIQYGYTQSANNLPVGPKFLRITDIRGGFIKWDEVPYCQIEDINIEKYKLEPNDIVIARTGATTGKNAFIDHNIPESIFASYLIRIKLKETFYPKFVYYFLQSDYYKAYIKSIISGSAQPNANAQKLTEVEIPLFSLERQKAIASILSKFDEKTEIIYQMNETLENISQTIFKSWFIDFEPFQDGEFLESEIGRIPLNWKIHKFTDKFLVGGGGTPKTKVEDYWNGDVLWATGKDISQNKGIFLTSSERKITELGLSRSSAKLYPKNTTVITARGTVGELKILSKDIAISQTCYALLPKNENHQYYLYLLASNMIDTLKRRAYGAIFDTITTRIFESYDIIYPPEKTLNRFDEIVKPIYDKILLNQKEIEELNVLRDLLLPQLISGRLRIANPEKFLEEIKN